MNFFQSIRDKIKLILIDAIILAIAPILALLLRFEGKLPAKELASIQECIPWIVIASIAIFYFYGMYHRIWHYARMRDLIAIVGAVTLAQALIFIVTLLAEIPVPRSVIILTWLISICAIGAIRLMFKINLDMVTESKGGKENLLIVGAGDAGAMLVRELEQNAAATTNIIGFVDDDEKKKNGRLAGFPILGTINELPQIVKANKVDEIVIAIPSADGDTIRHIDNQCRQTGAKVRIMPGIYEMVTDEMSAGEMREIRLEDLLRRDPIHLDFALSC